MNRKSQVAVEFLIVVGIAFTMLIPAMYLFSQYSSSSNNAVVSNQVDRVGRALITTAEEMYYYGKNSKTTINVYFPEKIDSIYLNPKLNTTCKVMGDSCLSEIVFNTSLFGGETHMTYFTKVNITADFTGIYNMSDSVTQGRKTFLIQSYGDYVNITRLIR